MICCTCLALFEHGGTLLHLSRLLHHHHVLLGLLLERVPLLLELVLDLALLHRHQRARGVPRPKW